MNKHIQKINWPAVAAAPGTHQEVLSQLVNTLKTDQHLKPFSLLDVPCGAGAFAQAAEQVGFDVTGLDIHPNEPYLADPSRRLIADANTGLPFANNTFEATCSIEGIEHLENPSLFLRELCRVTQPGGICVISTPNVDSYRSRRSVFFRGHHRYFKPLTETQKDSGHLHPIDLYFMMGALEKTDFELIDLSVNQMKGRGGPSLWREFVRKFLSQAYPDRLTEKVPFYGDVLIYVLKKKAPETTTSQNPNTEPKLMTESTPSSSSHSTPEEQTNPVAEGVEQEANQQEPEQQQADKQTKASEENQDTKEPEVLTLPSGVKIAFTQKGENTKKPKPQSVVTVHYEGRFLDGKVFDSSYQRGETISFPLNAVIPAWTQALCEMAVGDRATIFCPADTAYGPRGAGPIPPNTDLEFDVELFEIK